MMETVIGVVVGLATICWYMDRFIPGRRLEKFFGSRWRALSGKNSRNNPGYTSEHKDSDPDKNPQETECLIVEKWYAGCPAVTADAEPPKTVSSGDAGDTFTPATDTDDPTGTFEWRAPDFPRERKEYPNGPNPSMQWEDKDFAAWAEPEDDPYEAPDAEKIRREVVALMERIEDEQMQQELEPTAEELYGLEHFDAGAYQ